jgi:hypothetical protein
LNTYMIAFSAVSPSKARGNLDNFVCICLPSRTGGSTRKRFYEVQYQRLSQHKRAPHPSTESILNNDNNFGHAPFFTMNSFRQCYSL